MHFTCPIVPFPSFFSSPLLLVSDSITRQSDAPPITMTNPTVLRFFFFTLAKASLLLDRLNDPVSTPLRRRPPISRRSTPPNTVPAKEPGHTEHPGMSKPGSFWHCPGFVSSFSVRTEKPLDSLQGQRAIFAIGPTPCLIPKFFPSGGLWRTPRPSPSVTCVDPSQPFLNLLFS